MAAGLGFKTFSTGDVLSATDVNGYLMQGILVFASAAARDAAITAPAEGQFAYLKDTNVTTYYTGSAWANVDTTGMTNPMTTTGDTIYSSSGSTPARLGIGTTGQVLTVSAGVPAWATPTSGSMTQLATGTLSGASVSITSISGAYQDLILVITKFRPAVDGANLWLRMNNVTAANYASSTSGAGGASGTAGANQVTLTNQQDDTANSYSLMVFRFPQYANAITWKYLVGESVTNNSGDPLDINFSRPIGILSQTTAAITRIDLLSSSGNLTSGTYTLYGVI
jgi:hypothetical protein